MMHYRSVSILFVLLMSCGASNAKCNGECGEGEGDCDNNDDCLDGFKLSMNMGIVSFGNGSITGLSSRQRN